MKVEETKYICDRCGKEINRLAVELFRDKFKLTMSAKEYEDTKFGYLKDEQIPLPDEDIITLDAICGYQAKNIRKIHLCSKCTKDFKKFMNRTD